MSINAISSLSIYEYYYQINRKEDDKKESPLADELKKYGLTPTDNEVMNAALLRQAKALEESRQEAGTSQNIPNSDRPWADIMYQLNIPFNDDPKDDIEDIKRELAYLTNGMDDEELSKEITDLESYIEDLYIDFKNNYSTTFNTSTTLYSQLSNMALLNRATI